MDELQYVYGAVGFVVTLCVIRTVCIVSNSGNDEKQARSRGNVYLEHERAIHPKDNDLDTPRSNTIPVTPASRGLLHPYYDFLSGNRGAGGHPPPAYTSRANTTDFECSEAGSSFRTSNTSLLPSYKTLNSSIRQNIV